MSNTDPRIAAEVEAAYAERDAMLGFLSSAALSEALQPGADVERIGAEYRQAALDTWSSAPAQAEEGQRAR
jgi:hypothetical protein